MERLTDKIVYDNEHYQYVFDYNQDSEVGTKLGELEDVLEKYGIENLEEYIKSNQITEYAQNYTWALEEENIRVNTVFNLIKQENNDLKNELAELKQKVIVPKYKTGDKVYGIIDTWAYTDVRPVEIRGTHLLYEVWDGEDTTKQHFTRIFATKEEAEQKLAEIKGE